MTTLLEFIKKKVNEGLLTFVFFLYFALNFCASTLLPTCIYTEKNRLNNNKNKRSNEKL